MGPAFPGRPAVPPRVPETPGGSHCIPEGGRAGGASLAREALRPWEPRAPGSASRCTPSLDSPWSACSAWATCPGIGPSQASWLMGLRRPAISLQRLHRSLLTLSSSSPTTKGTTTWATTAQISRPQLWTGWQLRGSSWRITTSSPYVRLLGANSSLAGRHSPDPRDWVSKSPEHPVGRLQTLRNSPVQGPQKHVLWGQLCL